MWNKTYGGTSIDQAQSVQQTTDGGYIIAGYTLSFGAGTHDFWLIKTDKNGDELWNRTYGGIEWDQAWSVQQTSDGGYIVAGSTSSYGTGGDSWLIKTDENGNELWNRTYGGTSADKAQSVQQTVDGGYIIAGFAASYCAVSYDFWLIKTNDSGDELWNKTFGGPEYDHAYSVQQTSDGGYIMAGQSDGDFWLIKTDRDGNCPAAEKIFK